ncbi:hypothetical protein L226DRAFT_573132 [Lentinus tigrinus ALCF2SS1-7]|uniref:uncharacterized protein n=1 Tax=Lentinus tigrinus ALCF2SS1-7 TaxID=1328758 RepID=UPI0011662055|nr:hypothetical protein L226DRAFT_573132 [Lentinus tigrinus ALCF2SS1-7]
MDPANVHVNTEVRAVHLPAWYSTNGGEPSRGVPPMQKIIVAVTQTHYECKTRADRAALIVTAHDTGIVLLQNIIEKHWDYMDEPNGGPSDAHCSISMSIELPAPEGCFGETVYDSHWFRFDNEEDHTRFRELILRGLELASSYDESLRDELIQCVLKRGGHRPATVA